MDRASPIFKKKIVVSTIVGWYNGDPMNEFTILIPIFVVTLALLWVGLKD